MLWPILTVVVQAVLVLVAACALWSMRQDMRKR